jgi:PAS domain-containing protein
MLGCSMALVALLLWNNRLLHKAHQELRTLADDLRQTGSELAAANDAVGTANEELHRHNELFEAALNNMSQALCMADGEQRLIVCNRRFLEMFGLPSSLMKQGRRIGAVIQAIGEINRYPSELIEQICQEQLRLIRNDRLASFF